MPSLRALDDTSLTATLGQAFRFGIVGIISTLIHGVVAWMYLLWNGGSALQANLLGFCVALSWSFIGNVYWVFRFKGRAKDVFPKFLLLSLGSLALSTSISALADWFRFNPFWALAVVVLTIPTLSYVINRFLIFR